MELAARVIHSLDVAGYRKWETERVPPASLRDWMSLPNLRVPALLLKGLPNVNAKPTPNLLGAVNME